MDDPSFDAAFAATVAERGPAYLRARQAVIDDGPRGLAALNVKRSSTDWRVALQADILVGWLTVPALFRQCIDFVDGKLPGEPGITGRFEAKERGEAIAELGAGVTPCLLELVIKVRNLDEDQQAAVFAALPLIRDPSAIGPLLSLLEDEDLEIRRSAAGILGRLNERRAIPPLLALLSDHRQADVVRASAAASLGALEARQASPVLREVVADETASVHLRTAAVRALADLKDREAVATLVEAAGHTSDLPFLQAVIHALGTIGARSARPFLHKMKQHPDRFVREEAEDAERELAP